MAFGSLERCLSPQALYYASPSLHRCETHVTPCCKPSPPDKRCRHRLDWSCAMLSLRCIRLSYKSHTALDMPWHPHACPVLRTPFRLGFTLSHFLASPCDLYLYVYNLHRIMCVHPASNAPSPSPSILSEPASCEIARPNWSS